MFHAYIFTVTQGIQNDLLVKIDALNRDVRLTILASDDPYGQFAFQITSKNVTLAEDFYPGQEDTTFASLVVERRQGNFKDIQVRNLPCFR